MSQSTNPVSDLGGAQPTKVEPPTPSVRKLDPAVQAEIQDTIRLWKDPEYLQNLTKEERALIPANPAGEIERFLAKNPKNAGGCLNTATKGVFCGGKFTNGVTCCIVNKARKTL
jgi:mersacidin/lichenicidin family type 2 lantibiotic